MKSVFDACGGSMRSRGRGTPISLVLTLKDLLHNAPVQPVPLFNRGTVPGELNVNARTKPAARHLGNFVEIR
jgi:hypothetical protein